MVRPCECICDIGTDHAYIPIDLITRGVAARAIASDINKGPCKRAEENIAKHGLQEKIQVRLGGGFKTIDKSECTSAVMAGIGGHMMIDIFQESQIPKSLEQIVIQPQNVPHKVRKYLYQNGYEIENEKIVADEKHFYTIMSIKFTGKIVEREKIEFFINEKLITNKDKNLALYLDKEIERIKRILIKVKSEEHIWLLEEYIKIKEKVINEES